MDELDEARVELGRLEGTKRTLFKQLVEIRAAINMQKSKIDELVKKRPPAINRLPVELLSRIIFESSPNYLDYYHSGTSMVFLPVNRRADLSTVSRLWRSVILDTPKIWSDIVVWDKEPLTIASLETQLTRSGNVPLSVFIAMWDNCYPKEQLLDVLVPSASRWRCLHILGAPGWNRIFLGAFESLEFPSLEDVFIDMDEVSGHPQFLLPKQTPTLRNLQFLNLGPSSEFAAAMSVTLTTLTLDFREHRGPGQTMINLPLTLIPTRSLTTLSLAGDTSGWMLLPDSIHLPLLEVLNLAVSEPHPVMKAIIAPRLMSFDYSDWDNDNAGWYCLAPFNFGTGSKFGHVQRVNLNVQHGFQGEDALCREFSGVRRVSLHVACIHRFFRSNAGLAGGSGSVPADNWTSLESLTIYGSSNFTLGNLGLLVSWLTKRLELGRPRLSVSLSGFGSWGTQAIISLDLYCELQTCSNLAVGNVELSWSV